MDVSPPDWLAGAIKLEPSPLVDEAAGKHDWALVDELVPAQLEELVCPAKARRKADSRQKLKQDKKLHKPAVRSPPEFWTSDEDKILLDAIENNRDERGRPRWDTVASSLLGRTSQECRCRFRRMRGSGTAGSNRCKRCGAASRKGHTCTALTGAKGFQVVTMKVNGERISVAPENKQEPPTPPPRAKRLHPTRTPPRSYFTPICSFPEERGAPCSPAPPDGIPPPPSLTPPATHVLQPQLRGRWYVPPIAPTDIARDLTTEDITPPLPIDAQLSPVCLPLMDEDDAAIDKAFWRLGTVEPWGSVEVRWQLGQ